MTAERRHPLRFVWQMDADGRFIIESDEFIALVGPRTRAACNHPWSEVAATLKLDADNHVARAIATHETWSGISISWPVDETDEQLPVELSGLPVFGRDRVFTGYRGFGVCRDLASINRLASAQKMRPIGFMPAAAKVQSIEAADGEPQAAQELEGADAAVAANVVPFRTGTGVEAQPPRLSPTERNAFRELAQELTARLRGTQEEAATLGEQQNTVGEIGMPAGIATNAAQIAPDSPPDTPPNASQARSTAQAHQQVIADRALLDRVPAGVLVHRGNSLLYANRFFFDLTGYENLEALTAAGGLIALFAPRDPALADSGGAQKVAIVTQRGDSVAVEARLFSVPWDAASALALVVADGEPQERRRATQVALDAAQEKNRDLTSRLEESAEHEREKTAVAKAEFLARVSHEIRTPLNSIIGFAEVIVAERFGPIGNERYRQYLKDMHAAGTHLLSLLNDLLDLSKIELGQLDLAFADLDLNDLTQQCVAIMQPQANRARIIVRSALTSELPQITADARSLRQIALNLLANAIRTTGAGGQVIVSTAIADSGQVVLRVRDTGTGMQQSEIEAVLNPFRHSATSANRDSSGGLGLP
ncbi:MAG: PAS domain-containing sensor histidine kinase, partial [Xanthobacteraceae bacterium]